MSPSSVFRYRCGADHPLRYCSGTYRHAGDVDCADQQVVPERVPVAELAQRARRVVSLEKWKASRGRRG